MELTRWQQIWTYALTFFAISLAYWTTVAAVQAVTGWEGAWRDLTVGGVLFVLATLAYYQALYQAKRFTVAGLVFDLVAAVGTGVMIIGHQPRRLIDLVILVTLRQVVVGFLQVTAETDFAAERATLAEQREKFDQAMARIGDTTSKADEQLREATRLRDSNEQQRVVLEQQKQLLDQGHESLSRAYEKMAEQQQESLETSKAAGRQYEDSGRRIREAGAYAAKVREDADAYAASVRETADTYAAEVRAEANREAGRDDEQDRRFRKLDLSTDIDDRLEPGAN
jgi:flagellar biosynthesis GTPase FlhF